MTLCNALDHGARMLDLQVASAASMALVMSRSMASASASFRSPSVRICMRDLTLCAVKYADVVSRYCLTCLGQSYIRSLVLSLASEFGDRSKNPGSAKSTNMPR